MEEKTMKKIVALVLSLALVLALGTVAFAADTYSNAYSWNGSSWEKEDLTGVAIAYTKAQEPIVRGTNHIEGSLAFYTVMSDGHALFYAVETSKDAATARLDVNGKTVYLATLTDLSEISYDLAASAVKTGTKCGDVTTEGLYKATVDGEDVYFQDLDHARRMRATRLLVDGEIIQAVEIDAEEIEYVEHTWDAKTLNTTLVGGKTTGTIACKTCGKVANLTSSKADIPSGVDTDTYEGLYLYLSASNAGTTGTASNVTSAKTFDAGVAMYAGLALMSVAGSAVVIGKKKEF